MNHVSVTIRIAAALVLATLAAPALTANAEEGGTTTTTVTESGKSGSGTYRRQITITRSSSSSRSRSSSGAGKNVPSNQKKAPFKAGDLVLLEHAGGIVEGKVASVDRSSGWVQVKCDDGKKENVAPGQLIPAVRKGKKLLTSEPGLTGEFGVGDEVLLGFGGVYIAKVVEIGGNGWVSVKFESHGMDTTMTLPPSQLRLIENTIDPISLAEGAALREWSSQGAKFTIKAKFVELRGDSVTLKKEDGKSLTVAIDKLCDDDQQLARQLAEAAEGDSLAGNAGKK